MRCSRSWLENEPVHAQLDAPVLMFTTGITVFAASRLGWRRAPGVARGSRDGAQGWQPERHVGSPPARPAETLVAAQIAVSLVLLVGTSLFARSLLNLERHPLGFDQEHVLLARINPRLAGYNPTSAGSSTENFTTV